MYSYQVISRAQQILRSGSIVASLVTLLVTELTSCIALAENDQSFAGIKPGSLFQNSMVIQRDMPVPVWGTAPPGAPISVSFANQTKTTTTGTDGKWLVVLDALEASMEPRTMTIGSSYGKLPVLVSDVVVGEVWICSGQSNMQMGVNAAPTVKALIPKAKNIRSFEVKRTVAFTEQETCQGKWVEKHPNSAVAFAFAYHLEQAADVPVGIILSAWGSSSLEAWMPRDMTSIVPYFKTTMEEFDADHSKRNRILTLLNRSERWGQEDDIFLRRQPNILYNAMMKPLSPYACRGIVWYQGERNARQMTAMTGDGIEDRNSGMLVYGDVLKQWIQRYRKEWGVANFHFLIVMLPGFGQVLPTGAVGDAENPNLHSWAWMRESQLKALELPGTSVANAIDTGDLKNIHPNDKLPIGQRLALLAARDTLGMEVKAQGPMLKSIEKRDGKIIIRFDHATGLKTLDGKPPTGFWLADEAGQWATATAVIDRETVILHTPKIQQPLYIRYAFSAKPNVNLVNSDNLPTYPFRTDQFTP